MTTGELYWQSLKERLVKQCGEEIGLWLAKRIGRDIRRGVGSAGVTAGFTLEEGDKPSDVPGRWGYRRERTMTHRRSGRTFSWQVTAWPD